MTVFDFILDCMGTALKTAVGTMLWALLAGAVAMFAAWLSHVADKRGW